MNASIGFRGQAASRTAGGAGRAGAMKAQCGSYCAPCSIQRAISATSRGASGASPYGMRRPGSAAVMRCITALRSGSPGAITGRTPSAGAPRTAFFRTASASSRRRPARRVPESGPWHR